MNRKATSIWLSALLIGTIFTVMFMGSVSAMNDEQNLSGLVWRADGTAPNTTTDFCIWVERGPGGTWYRFPDAPNWAQTEMDINGNSWYSFVLPDVFYNIRWADSDIYRVQVDGTPWSNFNGNTTSNGTGSAGDPFKTPYDPTDLTHIDNDINYAAGGGFTNEQQWDVRTVAPLDLAPTNVTAYGRRPVDYPLGIPVPQNWDINIIFNVTNFGLIAAGPFEITLWNCTSTGQNFPEPPLKQYIHPGLPPGGDTLENVTIWLSPSQVGDFYVNITVDSVYLLPEFNEINNTFILHFVMGPDLVPTNVQVDGLLPTDPIYAGPGEGVVISSWVMNIGFSSTSGGEIIGAYYGATNLGEYTILLLFPGNSTGPFTWNWNLPWATGDYYIDIIVDVNDVITEASEANNIYTLHFFVGPDLVPNNVTVDGGTDATINPQVPIQIGVNASNIGVSSTGIYTFNITFIECDEFGVPLPSAVPIFNSSFVGPVPVGGFSQDVFGWWTPPLFQQGILDYYILISVDYSNNVSETNESNNYYILHLQMDAPDLTPFQIEIQLSDGTQVEFYPDPDFIGFVSNVIDIPVFEDITILITVINWGGVDMSTSTNVTFYNISGEGESPNATPFWQEFLPIINAGGTTQVTGIWTNPGPGGMGIYWYVNVSIDWNGTLEFNGKILELNEFNNTFTLIFNLTPIPITILNVGDPNLDYWGNGSIFYITSTTLHNLSAVGLYPPFFTWYRITNMTTSTVVLPWTNYTAQGSPDFNITWGEGIYRIEYNSTDDVGAQETTKSKIVIVDDSPPDTTIAVGDPRHRDQPVDNWNVTYDTEFTLSTVDYPSGTNIIGLDNAVGIDNPIKLQSGIFYRIFREGIPTPVLDWREGSQFDMDDSWLDGNYIIEYNSTDNLGNMEPTKSITVYLDNTGPSTSIAVGYPKYPDQPVPPFVKSDTPYTLSGDDGPGCGVNTTTFLFRIDNLDTGISIPWTDGDSFDIGTDGPPPPATEWDGNYSLRYYCLDWLGNSGSQGSIDLYVDETPPFVRLTVGTPRHRATAADMWNITDTTSLSLTGATDGAGCGISITEYRIYNDTADWLWQTYAGGSFPLTGFEDGEYTIAYRITDFLDNTYTASENVFLDTTPPTTDIDIGLPRHPTVPTFNITAATTITLTWDDIGTGVNVTWYQIYNSSGLVQDEIPYTGPFTLDGFGDDDYDIYYYSEDILRNVEATNLYTVYLDNTGPTVVITGGQTDWNTDENAWNIDFDSFFRLQADDGPGSGVDIREYSIDGSLTWLTYTAQFNLTLPDNGYWDHTIEFRARDNLGTYGPTGSLAIYIEGDITPPDPPVLRLYVQDDDMLLDWDPSPDPDVHHYLIYRSATKTGFNFTSVWVDTDVASDPVNGILALRTQWNDTGAVSGSTEYYYTIRGVDGRGNMGSPSNIAGKVTMTFTSGYNTFALPLEPFADMTATGMLSEDVFADTTDTIYRYDTESQQWMGKPKFLPSSLNDFDLMMGEGYMLYVKETTVEYTFTGAVATSIRYRGGVGDEDSFRNSLDVSVSGRSVELSWEAATDATGYTIYRAEERMGPGSLTDFTLAPHVEVGELTTSFTDTITGEEYYYMVVAQVDGVDSSGTYAVGVRTISYSEGYELISLELEPIIDDPNFSYYVNDMFTEDTSTLYYYDGNSAVWQGHPGFMPENMNNPDVGPGAAYLVFVYDQSVSYTFTGI